VAPDSVATIGHPADPCRNRSGQGSTAWFDVAALHDSRPARLSPVPESIFFQGNAMSDSPFERAVIVFFRLTMAWTFLYAASHQVFDPNFTVAAFLSHTKTFHNVYAVFTTPSVSPYITFLVSYGHLLIGLSLLVGLMVRISAAFGIALMLMYWTAHMDWPFIENTNNFIVDYHIVYAGVLVFLIGKHAGHVWGLDGWVEKLPLTARHSSLRPLVA
jgi:thiosulfate dehydrogenase [quinone] large subunit